jgi:hypothetical protein
LYLKFMSFAVSHMVLITASRILWQNQRAL